MYWIYATVVAGLLVAWLFDRRARRNGHRVRANLRGLTDVKYSHAGPIDPASGAPPFIFSRVEEVAREDLRRIQNPPSDTPVARNRRAKDGRSSKSAGEGR